MPFDFSSVKDKEVKEVSVGGDSERTIVYGQTGDTIMYVFVAQYTDNEGNKVASLLEETTTPTGQNSTKTRPQYMYIASLVEAGDKDKDNPEVGQWSMGMSVPTVAKMINSFFSNDKEEIMAAQELGENPENLALSYVDFDTKEIAWGAPIQISRSGMGNTTEYNVSVLGGARRKKIEKEFTKPDVADLPEMVECEPYHMVTAKAITKRTLENVAENNEDISSNGMM